MIAAAVIPFARAVARYADGPPRLCL